MKKNFSHGQFSENISEGKDFSRRPGFKNRFDKKGFWGRVRRTIAGSNVVLEIIDARFPEQTRNKRIENIARRNKKKVIVVFNKVDLIGTENARKAAQEMDLKKETVFVSCTEKTGTAKLRKAIFEASRGKSVKVSVVGYPNTGKSSVINLLKGRKTMRTSSTAGFTKGEQYARVSEKILLIVTPGVIPLTEMDETSLALIGARSPGQLQEPELAAEKLVKLLQGRGKEEICGVKIKGLDTEKAMEEIALRKGKLKKGGLPDVKAASKMLLLDWQKGKKNL